METRQLKLLLVEDSDDDTALLLRHLKKNGFEIEYTRIETAEDMHTALANDNWDIVLSDHSLPAFNSTTALAILNEYDRDIPLIILSGNIQQSVAVEAMRQGARDFIMKDDTTRLIPAIDRELRECGIRIDKRRVDAKIKHLAFHDGLTGLVNRVEFEKRLERAIKSAKEFNIEHGLLYMDLDHFKIVNDTCGHIAGDLLLKQLSDRLLTVMRHRDTLARVGGDEFCVLLETCNMEITTKLAQQIKETVKRFQFYWEGKVFKVGVSIGVLVIDHNSDTSDVLLSSADLACYTAKDKGRDKIEIYRDDDADMLRRRGETDWASQIDTALAANSYELHEQLIQPIQTNADTYPHHEILIRLKLNGNLILPGAFIPAAERYYRMVSIDQWVIRTALEKLHLIHQSQSNDEQPYRIAINLSGQSLADASLFNYVKRLFDEFQINTETVCFEITETAAISNFKNALNFMMKTRDLGCKLSLDDFGSGLSSFSYLKNMPVDYLKIDGVFVKNIVHDPMDLVIVEAINQIGHKAGMKTIAEFVENIEIRDHLVDIGVDYAQGYAIHKPSLFTGNI